MSASTDPSIIRSVPFTVRRVVKFGETDPSGFVYTPQFLHYAVEVLESWFSNTCGVHWVTMYRDNKLGTPMVHCGLDFFSPLYAEDPFDVQVILEHVGRSAFTTQVSGYRPDGTHCFQSKLVNAVTDFEKVRAISIPTEIRERMLAYQKACSEAS